MRYYTSSTDKLDDDDNSDDFDDVDSNSNDFDSYNDNIENDNYVPGGVF